MEANMMQPSVTVSQTEWSMTDEESIVHILHISSPDSL